MSQESPKTPLSESDLDAVAGGGSALEQIQQAIDETKKQPQNSNATMNTLPPSMMYPTSAPYNT